MYFVFSQIFFILKNKKEIIFIVLQTQHYTQ
eukprot:UN02448